jgi:Uma2 family endonuclease
MASEPLARMTFEDYLALEASTERRSELVDGTVFPMEAASPNHGRISANIAAQLYSKLSEECTLYTKDIIVKAGNAGVYPDVVVTCGEEHFYEWRGSRTSNDALLNPVLIVEVLSPSTADYDRGKKFDNYRTIESLKEYATVAQDKVCVQHFQRQSGGWFLRDYESIEESIVLHGIPIPLIDIYRKVSWPEAITTGA